MVQRKVPPKLAILAGGHHAISESGFKSPKSYHDIKNRGADLKKKKMKKSGSITPRSPNVNRHAKQPGKPQKWPVGAGVTATPNYMKSTTSSDARKGKAQVSIRSPQTNPDCPSLKGKNPNSLKVSSASGNKKAAAKILARTSSLKVISTPSFKPVRDTVKKCSPVFLCENLDVRRATCSSTLKDCKFPAYLTLRPGATEAVGTSTMKVCPYTYCSLNGHHHPPLPPLKCFLAERRRTIKTQRGIRLGCLSLRRTQPVKDCVDFEGELVNQEDWSSLTISLSTQEEESDFFIEIFSANKEGVSDVMPLVDSIDEKTADNDENQVLEAISVGTSFEVLNSHEDLDQNGDVNLTDGATTTEFHEENQKIKVVEEVSQNLATRETAWISKGDDIAAEIMLNGPYELDSEDSDMNWATSDQSALCLDDDYEYPSDTEKDTALEGGKVQSSIAEEEFISKLDNSISSCFSEFLAEEVSQVPYDEHILCSDSWSSGDDCESLYSYDNKESLKTSVPVSVAMEEQKEAFVDSQTSETGSHLDQTIRRSILVEDKTSFDYIEDQDSSEDEASNQTSPDYCHQVQTETSLYYEHIASNIEQEDHLETDRIQDENVTTVNAMDPAKAYSSKTHRVKAKNEEKPEMGESYLTLAIGKGKQLIQDMEEMGHFNPRAPNVLPLEPDSEAEKVGLRHQELDEKKNAEQWMVDYALRQVVTKLGPDRKRKVALLVEAFEKVMPTNKYELHLRQGSVFDQGMPIQACS